MWKIVVGLVVLVGVLIGALQLSKPGPEPLWVSGFIEADEIRVGSLVGGRVKAVGVKEGDRVEPGQVLVELEPFDLLEQRAQAAAGLAALEAKLAEIAAGLRPEEIAQAAARRDQIEAKLDLLVHGPRPQEIAAAKAELESAKAELDLARLEFERLEKLEKQEIATRERLDAAATRVKLVNAQVTARSNELALLEEGTRKEEVLAARSELEQAEQAFKLAQSGSRAEVIDAAKASVEAARSSLETLDRRIAELVIRAPLKASVDAVELQPGDLVAARAPVLSLVDLEHLWVRAYVPENRLAVQSGQEVEVTVDSHPGRKFRGKLSFIARNAEFLPSNVQTPEERSKQVFRIKVELLEGLEVLRPGMAADVHLGSSSTTVRR